MGKAKEMRRKTLQEQAALDKQTLLQQQETFMKAVLRLREVLQLFAKGENWALAEQNWWNRKTHIIWLGEGNPQEQAAKVLAEVFKAEMLQ